MANILLTAACSRSCPYCFAREEMARSRGAQMSWENLIYLADFLFRSEERRVALLGGEPTLHPDFVDYVLYLVERGFEVCVFTNGIIPPASLSDISRHLMEVPPGRLSFVCNLNDPDQTPAPDDETPRLHDFLATMGGRTTPGFNIYRPDFELEFIFDLALRHGMSRSLRLGIAHPLPGRPTGCIRPEQVKAVIERLYSYKPLMDRLRIKPGLDCGFPICKFTDEQLGWLYRLSGHAKFECGPAVDIAPDMSVYSCFPLSSFKRRSIFEFDDMKQVKDYYAGVHALARAEIPGIYDECDGCIHREEGVCHGGGCCHLLDRFMAEARVRLPEIEGELPKDHLSA